MGGLLLVSISVGLGNFAAAIGIGLSGVDARTRLRTGIVFGFFEAVMPLIGLAIGHVLAESIGSIGRYVGAVLLVLTGAYAILQARVEHEAPEEPRPQSMRLRHLLVTGFALGIDNLIVGFALSLYQVPVLLAALIIAAVSVSMSLAGLELGQRLGERFEKWSEEFGGAMLILVGLALGLGLL